MKNFEEKLIESLLSPLADDKIKKISAKRKRAKANEYIHGNDMSEAESSDEIKPIKLSKKKTKVIINPEKSEL